MGRRSGLIGALITAHARSVREQNARQRHQLAQARRHEQARAAAARADAAEQRAVEAGIRASAAAEARHAKARERAEKDAERQRLRDEKEEERQVHLDAQESAEERTIEVADIVADLQGVLAYTLDVDDRIEFDSLRVHEPPPEFVEPNLTLPSYVPDSNVRDPIRPASLEALLKAKVRPSTLFERVLRSSRVSRETEQVTVQHEAAISKYQQERESVERVRAAHRKAFDLACEKLTADHAKRVGLARRKHELMLAAYNKKRQQRDAEITALETSYRNGEVDSVVLYTEMVLSRSDYPSGFPQQFRLAYQPE